MLRQIVRNSIQQTKRISFLKTRSTKLPHIALFQKTFVSIAPKSAVRQFGSTSVQFNEKTGYTIT